MDKKSCKTFPLLQFIQIGSEANTASYSMSTNAISRGWSG